MSAKKNFTALFAPQAWIGDQAVSVDGPSGWDCTEYARKLMSENADSFLHALKLDERAVDNDDVFKEDPNCPAHIKMWQGPFVIYITRQADDPEPKTLRQMFLSRALELQVQNDLAHERAQADPATIGAIREAIIKLRDALRTLDGVNTPVKGSGMFRMVTETLVYQRECGTMYFVVRVRGAYGRGSQVTPRLLMNECSSDEYYPLAVIELWDLEQRKTTMIGVAPTDVDRLIRRTLNFLVENYGATSYLYTRAD